MENKLTCRICLKASNLLKPILEGHLGAAIYLISGVQIIDFSSHNGISKICHICLSKLNAALDFRDLCKKSDQHHRRTLFAKEQQTWNQNLLELYNASEQENEVPMIKYEAFPNESPIKFEIVSIKQEKADPIPSARKPLPRNPRQNKLQCKHCDLKFLNINTLKRHTKDSHGLEYVEKVVSCHRCNTTFTTYTELTQHIIKEHTDFKQTPKSLVCGMCSKSFVSTRSYMRHRNVAHKKDIEQSSKKKKDFSHIIFKSDVPVPKNFCRPSCIHCNKWFPTYFMVERHIKRAHGNIKRKMICDICNKKCTSRNEMKTHLKTEGHFAKDRNKQGRKKDKFNKHKSVPWIDD